MTATLAASAATTWACPDSQLVLPVDRTYSPEWYALRQTGIGSSDLAAMYGQSHWSTPYSLWLEKIEGGEWDEESEAMFWGKELENTIAVAWSRRMGLSIRNVGTQRSKTHPHALANPDRLTSDGGGVEVKTANAFAKGWSDGGAPADYVLQAEMCMAVTGRSHWWLVCLQGGQKLHVRKINRDEQRMRGHLDAVEMWWAHHVDRLIPPEMGAPVPIEVVQSGKAREASLRESVLYDLARWRELLDHETDCEAELAVIKQRLGHQLGDAEFLTVDRVPVIKRVTRKGSKKFNRKQFEKDHPDLAARYVEVGDPTQYISLIGGNDE